MVKRLYGSVSALALAVVAIPAFAQDGSGAQEGGQSRPEAGANQLGDIVVTASRRTENAQNSALSIQAISPEALARASVTRPEDINALAPSIQIGTGGNVPQVYIRGIGNFAVNGLAESAVAFNIDGVYVSRGQGARGVFFDLERVEVLKGPQGTLYGRNASGGAVNVITAKPKLSETSGFAEIELGNYNRVQGSAALNLPLGETLALRAAGQIVSRDGYLSDGYDDDRSQSARLQLKWEPSSVVSLLLSGSYQHINGKGTGAAALPQLAGDNFRGASDPAVVAIYRAQPGLGPLLNVPSNDGYVDYSIYGLSAELNWKLGFATLTVLPAYRYSKLHDVSYVASFYVDNNVRSDQKSLEVRLGNDNDMLKWVVGGFLFDENVRSPGGDPAQFVKQGPLTQSYYWPSAPTKSAAVFGQATYSISARLRLTGGLRYTNERKSLEQMLNSYGFTSGTTPPACAAGTTFDPNTPTPPLFCKRVIDLTGSNSSRLTFNNVTWKAGLEYDIAHRSLAYFNVATGFKSGGFFAAPQPNTFMPEKLLAFDVGVKNRFLNNTLQVNFEAFYWRYTDHQETSLGPTSIPGYSTLLTYNAGKAKSYGGQIDIIYRPTESDELTFNVQYNKTKYDAFQYSYQSSVFGPPKTGCAVSPIQNGSQTVDCQGKPLMRAPLWAGQAGYAHTFDFTSGANLRASVDAQFSSSYFLSTDFLGEAKQGSFAIANMDLTYTTASGRVSVGAYFHNIFDKAVYTQAFRSPFISEANPLVGANGTLFIGTLRPPRTFGGRVRVSF